MVLLDDVLAEFRTLMAEAERSGDPEPTAMNLASVDGDGRIHSRIVLLKGAGTDGFRFFTNYQSAKGTELVAHPQVALCLHWKSVREGIQVRIEGAAQKLPAADSDAYFATRPRGSQVGAWASLQSQTLPDRAEFEARIAQYERQFEGGEVPRPPHWGGYRVVPEMIEIWYGARFRLHERHRYERGEGGWTRRLLYP
ncbi:pyridoxamine 5'-phosphate oxidase [Tahibacter amnicola]|uniref:Pyridoxine/pyridoxamine 5'-phosphate oxidase n=1 Tax=Tahibacter amnicola TaxID=2976241 RepID=A0ABY6BHS1_9GAMM|nr:pyridoxamine 5'-phosphate oxidase [Tahibacter amnicola]UXI69339.1 pyridoxamine 5'-phosphate oxidase [Tahibacter amnicola]